MKEFGSDFHTIKFEGPGDTIEQLLSPHRLRYYALGRHALEAVVRHQSIDTVWFPSYYCYESIPHGIKNVSFYPVLPTDDIDAAAGSIRETLEKHGDRNEKHAVVLMNYFGLHGDENTPELGDCMVIEDHSHDLTSRWARNSKADWCFASMRKTLPISEGGVLWSPADLQLPADAADNSGHIANASQRREAMLLKEEYINGNSSDKEVFYNMLRHTEENMENLPISPLSDSDMSILNSFPIEDWYARKRRNWLILKEKLKNMKDFVILEPENFKDDSELTPFSLILLFKSRERRDEVRKNLINSRVYPAILWNIPESCISEKSIEFGRRMLSLHCDGRYSEDDMSELAQIIVDSL